MRRTKNLAETVRHPLISVQISEPFTFTRNRARRSFLEHETSPQRSFILRPTAADAPPTFHHSKHLQIPRLPMQIRPPAAFVTHLSPGKRSPLVHMRVTGPFWTKAKVRSRSTEKTRRSRSSRCASC